LSVLTEFFNIPECKTFSYDNINIVFNNHFIFLNKQHWYKMDCFPWYSKYTIYWHCSEWGKIFEKIIQYIFFVCYTKFFPHKILTTSRVIFCYSMKIWLLLCDNEMLNNLLCDNEMLNNLLCDNEMLNNCSKQFWYLYCTSLSLLRT
jgi:hypothetical protein